MKIKEQNQEIVLAEHPAGIPTLETFKINDIKTPTIKEGEVLLKTLYVSVDPGMRGFMDKGKNDAAGKKFKLNKPVTSRTVAQVVQSKSSTCNTGDIVHGRLCWQKYQSVHPQDLEIVDPALAPISTAVSILGVTGLCAYFGLLQVGNIQRDETVVVSGAAGSVGSAAVQIAKLHGCKVVGIAGSEDKIKFLEEDLGVDVGLNYKTTTNMADAIKKACPNGVDVFFDNVGGDLFDAVLQNINRKARLVICGQIADYNEEDPPKGLRPQHTLIKKSAKMEGFVVFDYKDDFDDAKKQLAAWLNAGKIKYKENLIEGFDQIPAAFIGLFSGENIGKQMVKVAEADEIS